MEFHLSAIVTAAALITNTVFVPQPTGVDIQFRAERIRLHMTKWQAYKWMQGKLALTDEQAHIAKFSEYMCDRLIIECNRALENQRIAA